MGKVIKREREDLDMRKNFILTFLASAIIATLGLANTAYAGAWKTGNEGWWYDYGNGTYPNNTWAWIDGDDDGVSECYYFGANGYMLSNSVTPDGYYVNQNGAWVLNGVVQTIGTKKVKNESKFRRDWIWGKYTHLSDELDATAEIGYGSGEGVDEIILMGGNPITYGVGEFSATLNNSGNTYWGIDEYGNKVKFIYNGIDKITIESYGNFGGLHFGNFDGVYTKVEDYNIS
jgi:hypothetical protein